MIAAWAGSVVALLDNRPLVRVSVKVRMNASCSVQRDVSQVERSHDTKRIETSVAELQRGHAARRSESEPDWPEQFRLPLPFDASTRQVETCPHAAAGRLPAARPRVISASKRTDIPAFYLRWMIARIEAGWVDVPNPMFRRANDPLKRLTHVSLRPEQVIAIVWWSKNYAVYERLHQAFAGFPIQYFHFTINPRRPDLAWIEPDVPPLDEALRQARFVASLPGGPEMVAWRYDPIMFWREADQSRSSWDPDFFERMCRELSGVGITRCITSLADRYRKFEQRIRRNFPQISLRDPSQPEIQALATEMADIASRFRMVLQSCTEPGLACQASFTKAACIDGRELRGPVRPASDKKMSGREECGCTVHTDIGDYVTQECGYSCVYCYANPSHRRFAARAQEGASGGASDALV